MNNFSISSISSSFQIPLREKVAFIVFTTRKGGFSKEEYSSLNLSPYVGDDGQAVLKNRKKVAGFFGKNIKDITTVNQVHGGKWYPVQKKADFTPGHLNIKADALITGEEGVPIGVLVADCIPLIVVSSSGRVAAVHAGRKSLLKGIIRKTIKELNGEFESETYCFMGPSICDDCYEVNKDVAREFENEFPETVSRKESRYFLNLKKAALTELTKVNVDMKNVVNWNHCTRCLSSTYYSYRKNKETGRQAGIVCLKARDK